jgi:glucose-6-phosphate isomerase
MPLRLDDALMFRPALDALHGLAPAALGDLQQRFPSVRAAIAGYAASGEYGFRALGLQDDVVAKLERYADDQRPRIDDVLVLGIGGSALGAKALLTALRPPAWNEWGTVRRDGLPGLTILENVDPVTATAALDRLDPRRTLVNVISKSGTTAETLAQYLIVRHWLDQALGAEGAREHLVFTTDPEVGALRSIARREGIPAFEVPPAVGGRFSVLSAVGLLPAALVGIDIAGLLAGAATALADAESEELASNHAARWAGLQWQAQLTRAANVHVLMPYSDRLRDVGEWFRQLWAESLGKRHDRQGREVFRGPTPVAALGATDQHSQVQLFAEGPFDKTITFVRVMETRAMLTIPTRDDAPPAMQALSGHSLGELLDAEFLATREALRAQGRMSMTLELDAVTPESVGELLMFFQLATGFAGAWYDVNPFDQPGVELGKELTRKAMGR